jgi:hypothetical protein
MVFHPPIRHDEARGDSQRPETGAGQPLRRTDLLRETPPPGTDEPNDAGPRETGGLQQRWGMRDDGAARRDIGHAGRHASEELETGAWGAQATGRAGTSGALEGMTVGRSGRVSDARHQPSWGRGSREVVRPAGTEAPPRGAPERGPKGKRDGARRPRNSHLGRAGVCTGRRLRAAAGELKPHPPSAASDPLAGKTQPKSGWPWRQGPAPPGENPKGYDGAQAVPTDEANGPDHA